MTLPAGGEPTSEAAPEPRATVVVVAYGVEDLDLSGVPDATEVIVVHNDRRLRPERCLAAVPVRHVPSDNRGFGASANLAAGLASGERLVFCNPDAVPRTEHFAVLAAGAPHEMVTVPQRDRQGRPCSVVSGYPTPASLAATVLRLGRIAPRGGSLRARFAPWLGRWGRLHVASLEPVSAEASPTTQSYSLADHWVSAAVLSVDRRRFEAVGGFDERYFLYREDVDLCRRLAERFPDMTVVVAGLGPALHAVGATAVTATDQARVRWARWDSAATYSAGNRGMTWRALASLTRGVASILARQADVSRSRRAERALVQLPNAAAESQRRQQTR